MRSRNEAHQFIRPIANLTLNKFQTLKTIITDCAMPISFDSSYTMNGAFGISFETALDGSTVVCSVSSEALQDIDPSKAQCSPEEQFMANRAAFEGIAKRKILAGEQPPIRINSADVSAKHQDSEDGSES